MDDRTVQQSVLECLAENYGVCDCGLQRLPGENMNFLVTCGQGSRYVFKIVGEDIPPQVVEMEKAAIEHAVSRGFEVRLPQILENRFSTIETGITIRKNSRYRARLLEFIDGKPLCDRTDISINLLKNLGRALALFHRVMQDFHHPAARRDHRWNLATAGRHEDKVGLFRDRGQRELLTWAYRGWQVVVERMNDVPRQFIHGDAHDENWMTEGDRVTGLLDFGDSCHNPAVCDLAICLAYLMMRGADPLPIAAAVVSGYQSVRPLTADELALLFPLAAARLAVSVCVSAERRSLDAGHPTWFTSEDSAWRLLRKLRGLGAAEFTRCLR